MSGVECARGREAEVRTAGEVMRGEVIMWDLFNFYLR